MPGAILILTFFSILVVEIIIFFEYFNLFLVVFCLLVFMGVTSHSCILRHIRKPKVNDKLRFSCYITFINMIKIFPLQKKIFCILTSLPYGHSSKRLFQRFGVINIFPLYNYIFRSSSKLVLNGNLNHLQTFVEAKSLRLCLTKHIIQKVRTSTRPEIDMSTQ